MPFFAYSCDRFVVQANPGALPTFERALFVLFTAILQQDIDRKRTHTRTPHRSRTNEAAEYIPYVFQVLAQMLELHTSGVPDAYRGLLPMLLKVDAWAQKGSVPGLVKLLKAFLARDAQAMVAAGQVNQVLGVVQQRLIPSKANDGWGFELLQAVALNVPA